MVACTTTLVACQSTSQNYNGQSGYQIEQQNPNSATLSYTLASNQSAERQTRKLQDSCRQTLGANKIYNINIIDTVEVMAQPQASTAHNGLAIAGSKTSFGFSNTPDLANSTNAYSNLHVSETRPSSLKKVRYTCS